MATLLPSGYVVSPTGNWYATPTEKFNGGMAIGVTSATTVTAGSPLTRTFPVLNNALEGVIIRRSLPVLATGALHAFSTQKAYTAGTFAYTQSDFIVRTMATTINGVANTAIKINGNEQWNFRRDITNKVKGAQTSTAWRNGYFRFLSIAGQRTPWSTAPSSNNVNLVTPTGTGVTVAADQAIYNTYKNIPGELTYMYGALNPRLDVYKSGTGG